MPTKKSVLGEKWEAFKNKVSQGEIGFSSYFFHINLLSEIPLFLSKMRGNPVYKRVNEYTKPVVSIGQEVPLQCSIEMFDEAAQIYFSRVVMSVFCICSKNAAISFFTVTGHFKYFSRSFAIFSVFAADMLLICLCSFLVV